MHLARPGPALSRQLCRLATFLSMPRVCSQVHAAGIQLLPARYDRCRVCRNRAGRHDMRCPPHSSGARHGVRARAAARARAATGRGRRRGRRRPRGGRPPRAAPRRPSPPARPAAARAARTPALPARANCFTSCLDASLFSTTCARGSGCGLRDNQQSAANALAVAHGRPAQPRDSRIAPGARARP